MKVYVNLPEINFKWCKIKPSDLLKSWDPELELITWYFQMLEFLILKTESNNLDLITYTTFFYDKGPKYMGHNFSKAKDLHHHSTRGVVYQHVQVIFEVVVLPKVTTPEAILTGSHRTRSDVKEACSAHARIFRRALFPYFSPVLFIRFPALFPYYSCSTSSTVL
jgi:hypothetical protein